MDLSSSRGSSINDFIAKEDYTLHYASFDQALVLVFSFGTGALMAKLDLKHAFHLCPVSPIDRDLVSMHWQGKFFVDLRLSSGLCSSPFLFNRLADAFEWILIMADGPATATPNTKGHLLQYYKQSLSS